MFRKTFMLAVFVTVFMLLSATPLGVFAGQPTPWQIDFQESASYATDLLVELNNTLLVVVIGITALVLGLMAYACFFFSAKRNKVASKTSHNTPLEIIWTAIPIVILAAIAVPSLHINSTIDKIEEPELTLKIVGHQWYWNYEYPDYVDISFDSYLKKDKDLKKGEPRLLATDNYVILPTDTNVRILVTAADVIHNWAVPSLGVKVDAVPGRLNESWLRINKPGNFYGQCSELCGKDHGFMPVAIKAVSRDEFDKWALSISEPVPVEEETNNTTSRKRKTHASNPNTNVFN